MKLEIRMHDGWHIPKCPIKNCTGHGRVTAISLDELAQHRVQQTVVNVQKVFDCGHQHDVTLRP